MPKSKPNTKETERAVKASRDDPTSTENVLKNVIKYQKISTEYFDKMSKSYEEKVQTLNLSLIDRNQEIAQLKKKLKETEGQIQELNSQNSELTKTNRLLNEKNAMVYGKYVSLEVDYDQQIKKLDLQMNKQRMEILTQQKRNEELSNELTSKEEDNQRAMAQCEAIVQEKEQQIAELQLELTKLQEHTAQLQAVLEKERSQQLEQKHELQLQFDKAQASLKTKIHELTDSLDEQIKIKVQLENELQGQIQKLQESEKQNDELQQQQHNLTIESSDAARRLESSIEIKQAKIDELQITLTDLKAVFEVDLKCQQAKTEELKAANEELNAKIIQNDAEAQQKLNKQEEQMTELKNKWHELEHQQLEMIKQLSTDKVNLEEQMKSLNEVHEIQLTKLCDTVKQREDEIAALNKKYFDLEMEKNTVITELNQKISCIGDVVVSGKEKSNEKNAKKTEEVHSLSTMKGTSAATAEGKRLKKTLKRSAPYPMYESDWKTESEDGDSSPNYKPKQKKQITKPIYSKYAKVKRVEPLTVFDSLKSADN